MAVNDDDSRHIRHRSSPDEVLLRVENAGKKFCTDLKRSLWYGVKDIASEVFALNSKARLRKQEFWANKSISFELRRGEIIGIIGPNGAGKTTLLKMINGIIKPDEGTITIKGAVGALIALGAGFNPILTARENIYINSAVLGVPKRKIDESIEKIIAFAELEDFVDTPVQNYSSGMRVRLGFSVAINIAPDVLIIDEVLAVGDQAFKRKAQEQIRNLLSSGVAVLFVSHNLTQVARLCSRVIHLEHGKIKSFGDAGRIVASYIAESEEQPLGSPLDNAEAIMTRAEAADWDKLIVHRIQLFNQSGVETACFNTFDDIIIQITFELRRHLKNMEFQIKINTMSGELVCKSIAKQNESEIFELHVRHAVQCRFIKAPIGRGRYSIDLFAGDEHGYMFKSTMAAEITFETRYNNIKKIGDSVWSDEDAYSNLREVTDPSLVHVKSQWERW